MNDEPASPDPPHPAPIVSTKGLSERQRELLHGTQRTDEPAPTGGKPHRVIRSLWWPLLYSVLALSFADLAVAPLIWASRTGWPTAPLICVCGGLITAQVYLIALGLVFGRHSLASRLILSWLLLFLVFLCGTAGYFSSVFTAEEGVDLGGQRWFALAGMAWCVLMAALLGLVAPLCLARGLLGWKLTNPDEIRERQRLGPEPTSKYSLQDLLVLMTMLGLTLGVPRFTYDPRAGRYDDENFWAALAACVLASGFGSLILLWFAWRLLRPRDEAATRFYNTIVSLFCLLLVPMGLLAPFGLANLTGAVLGLAVWFLSFLASALSGLLVLHAHGWRLESARRPLVVA